MARKISLEESLQQIVDKLEKSDLSKAGDIVFNLRGEEPFRLALESRGKSKLYRTLSKTPPRLEISGDANSLQTVLDGTKDPRHAFLEGGITVRGDLDYLQAVLRDLGLLT